MNSENEIYIFDLENMENCEKRAFEIPKRSSFRIDDLLFNDGVISSLTFEKVCFTEKDYRESLFITAYAGHLEIATLVVREAYTFKIERQRYYAVKKTSDYDYMLIKEKDKNE